MASIDPSASARNASDEYNPPPALGSHALHTGLGDDKLAAGVDLHDLIPVVLLDVLDISNSLSYAGVGDEDRNGFVLSSNLLVIEYLRRKSSSGLTIGQVCADTDKYLGWVKLLKFGS